MLGTLGRRGERQDAKAAAPGPAPAPSRGAARAAGRALLTILWGIWLPAALIALWWVVSAASHSTYFPSLHAILTRLWHLWIFDHARVDLVPSMAHFAIGYAGAALAGIAFGAVFWASFRLQQATSPLVYFLYVLPSPVLIPAAILFFGIGGGMKVAIIFFASLWPILLNSVDGMRGVDLIKLDAARSMGLSRWRLWFSVVLPAASPQIVAGLRAGLQVAIILMVVSEFAASTSGIGFFISNAQQSFAITDMWTGIIVLGIVGSFLNFLFLAGERWVLRWYYGARALAEERR
ncbi:MAG: ABC transporter permease [Acidimicrobiales bacterium]|nr:ABC transporter permease [Acidimicrobiales bacterium]MBO0886669.1 ABC transporter permease [Acidimicrobiales bacterium]MBO0893148.1 ABC transporter permease [Acidimicrobiales bacterium]